MGGQQLPLPPSASGYHMAEEFATRITASGLLPLASAGVEVSNKLHPTCTVVRGAFGEGQWGAAEKNERTKTFLTTFADPLSLSGARAPTNSGNAASWHNQNIIHVRGVRANSYFSISLGVLHDIIVTTLRAPLPERTPSP